MCWGEIFVHLCNSVLFLLVLLLVRNSNDLNTKCLSKSVCALIVNPGELSNSDLSVVRQVHQQARNVTFATLDTTAASFSLQRKLPAGA